MKYISNLKQIAKRCALPAVAVSVVGATAFATGGGGANTFDAIYDMVKDWTTGTLGKLLAASAFLIGMGIGVVRQSILAVALGLAFALTLAYAPDIIDSVFTFAV